jgi:hypothetical protein
MLPKRAGLPRRFKPNDGINDGARFGASSLPPPERTLAPLHSFPLKHFFCPSYGFSKRITRQFRRSLCGKGVSR